MRITATLNYEGYEKYLSMVGRRLGGIQYTFRFPNNYGASVIKHLSSYGHEDDLWELAVIKYDDALSVKWKLVYDTGVTEDVEGWLSDEQVRTYLGKIKEL
jgi:hypothetical protein